MDSPDFRVVEHTIPCQYIREYPNATQGQRDDVELQLAVKQYQPVEPVADDAPNAVTIIGAHATGIPKEVYEPLWDELHRILEVQGIKIRGIWIADMSNQGASGVLNERIQGDDPGWFDHSRDMLHMLNVFRKEIKRPIFGIGHSMGATCMTGLSLMHPRLFAGLALIEPMIQPDSPPGGNFARGSSNRRDLWATRDEAETALRKSMLTAAFDPRALQRMSRYGLRQVPTTVYPEVKGEVVDGSLTLTTSKHQEVWAYLRANWTPSTLAADGSVSAQDRLLAPDVDHATTGQYLFFRPEITYVFTQLPHLRPRVLWVSGGKSPMSTPDVMEAKVKATGTGLNGGGGVEAGQVETHHFPKYGHMLACEHVADVAEVTGNWLVRTLEKWKADEKMLRSHDYEKSKNGMLVVSDKWMEMVKNKGKATRPRVVPAEKL